ncbi:hypothetical protein FIBSPDRAFT_961413 [Athelia psychrophila]|uniref:Uncharacterized protein n=1 Tax=Athelia psychrophila TaxID=1759441 RepID=A0A166BB96_9AGAM|nr:hypothetical protein FIBSPDRAFT_961413 [Fibularhizoctonia sp. CBS 109695]
MPPSLSAMALPQRAALSTSPCPLGALALPQHSSTAPAPISEGLCSVVITTPDDIRADWATWSARQRMSGIRRWMLDVEWQAGGFDRADRLATVQTVAQVQRADRLVTIQTVAQVQRADRLVTIQIVAQVECADRIIIVALSAPQSPHFVSKCHLLLRRELLAIPEAIRTANDFKRFDTRLREQDPEETAAMEKELAEWEADKSKPDPYRLPKSNVMLAQVKLVMAEEEKARAEAGLSFVHDVSAGVFLLLGLSIQTAQQTLRTEVKGLRKQTILQTTTLVERRTTLLKHYQRFRELQRLYMVGFDPIQYAQGKGTVPTHVEYFPLYMPSELPKADARKYCPNGLAGTEDHIRYAEASDALESLRHHLRTRSFANRFKIANVTGQIQNTRARETQNRIDDKSLRGSGNWEIKLQVLNNQDVRALNERELTQQEKNEANAVHVKNGVVTPLDLETECRAAAAVSVGEGHRAPSWIWFRGLVAEQLDDPLTRKALRVEWVKEKARKERWGEEVVLVDEDMRRVLHYGVSMDTWWREQLLRRQLGDDVKSRILSEGLRAYAEEHIDREAIIIERWSKKWRVARELAAPIIAGDIPDDCHESFYAAQMVQLDEEMAGDELEDDDFEIGGPDT